MRVKMNIKLQFLLFQACLFHSTTILCFLKILGSLFIIVFISFLAFVSIWNLCTKASCSFLSCLNLISLNTQVSNCIRFWISNLSSNILSLMWLCKMFYNILYMPGSKPTSREFVCFALNDRSMFWDREPTLNYCLLFWGFELLALGRLSLPMLGETLEMPDWEVWPRPSLRGLLA